MKKILKISQLTRKKIAIFLMLNFVISSILGAFPNEKCDGICDLDQESHKCTDIVEMTCCDMMNIAHNNNSATCGMEVAENSCDYELDSIDNITFIIPENVNSKIELIEISSFNLEIEKNISNSFILSQNFINDVSPPIYLTVSSFLI